MKTGFDLLTTSGSDNDAKLDFLRKSVSIMKVLAEEALNTSVRFAKCCGRDSVHSQDMYYALMYEAHEFFDKDIDAKFFENLHEEEQHTYETEDEDEDEEMSDDVEEYRSEYSDILQLPNEEDFYNKVKKYAAEWDTWFPDDPIKQMIKNSIDKTKPETFD